MANEKASDFADVNSPDSAFCGELNSSRIYAIKSSTAVMIRIVIFSRPSTLVVRIDECIVVKEVAFHPKVPIIVSNRQQIIPHATHVHRVG